MEALSTSCKACRIEDDPAFPRQGRYRINFGVFFWAPGAGVVRLVKQLLAFHKTKKNHRRKLVLARQLRRHVSLNI